MKPLLEKIQDIANQEVSNLGFNLVDVELKGSHKQRLIRVYITHLQGVTIDDCSVVSRAIMDRLDQQIWEMEQYRLEVSSPGLDRPLKVKEDFDCNKNKQVMVQFIEDEKQIKLTGIIEEVFDDSVRLRMETITKIIPFEAIVKAKQTLKW